MPFNEYIISQIFEEDLIITEIKMFNFPIPLQRGVSSQLSRC